MWKLTAKVERSASFFKSAVNASSHWKTSWFRFFAWSLLRSIVIGKRSPVCMCVCNRHGRSTVWGRLHMAAHTWDQTCHFQLLKYDHYQLRQRKASNLLRLVACIHTWGVSLTDLHMHKNSIWWIWWVTAGKVLSKVGTFTTTTKHETWTILLTSFLLLHNQVKLEDE